MKSTQFIKKSLSKIALKLEKKMKISNYNGSGYMCLYMYVEYQYHIFGQEVEHMPP